jgi:penicillin-binding protein 1C
VRGYPRQYKYATLSMCGEVMANSVSGARWRSFIAGVLAALMSTGAAWALPAYDEVRAGYSSSETLLLDRHGRPLQELRTDRSVRRLAWVPLEAVSPALLSAVVGAEDRRFYDHAGVDWRALAAAALRGLPSWTFRGASTIPMQLAALIDPALRAGEGGRSLGQKWRQVRAALELDARWRKEEMLEAYLNLVFFRGEYQGVGAACRALFHKSPHGVDAAEALVLAALVRSPNADAERVAARALRLKSTLRAAAGDEAVRQAAARAGAGPHVLAGGADLAPHAARRLAAAGAAGPVLRSTLDGGLQAFARERLARQLDLLQGRAVGEGAVLVVENRSGDVLAYAVHTLDPGRSRYVDGVLARRQAGSTLKPFLYALAFDRRILTPATRLDDSPLDVPVAGGIYQPRNYDSGYHGTVTARAALAASMNIPAVRAAGMTGVDLFLQTLRELGFGGLEEEGDFYGPSLALGTADVSLWELVAAYRALAVGGTAGAIRLSPAAEVPPGRRVFSAEAAFLVTDILADREARSATFGLENPLSPRFPAAVKTGTSKDMRDNWCVGYSRSYTVGVWVGNFSGAPMREVSGVTGAAPLWMELMNFLRDDEPILPGEAPHGLVRAETGVPPRAEWFVRGTVPVADAASARAEVRITYPSSEAVLALDPDIPPDRQRVVFAAQAPAGELRWTLDGRPLAETGATVAWRPEPGSHELTVSTPGGGGDRVRFQVRGLGPTRPVQARAR